MTGYRKGASFENLVKDILIAGGWLAIRSAGSHSIVDVLAINAQEKWICQCRINGNISQKEREELIALSNKHKATPILAYKKEGNIILEEVKLLRPTFHYEMVDGSFVKVANNE